MYEALYRSLYRIRRVEEEIARVYPSDMIKSPIHLSIGQEAVAVGVCLTLQPDDVIFGTYRGHAQYLAKGGDLKKMVAELYGKVTGCSKGKGGSMHLADVQHGVMGTSAVVGTTIPNAVGYAYALKYLRKGNIVVSFFGDGAVDEGVFYESLNFASLKQLPILFVCENNRYAIHSAQLARQPLDNITDRARVFGIAAKRIENNDVIEIYESAKAAVQAIRDQQTGPVFLECMTYRWREHVGPNSDYQLGYRKREEAEPWIKGDQLGRLASALSVEQRQQIAMKVEEEIRQAFEHGANSPFPEMSELYTDVFKEA
jgi:TPP-dependent pyruvate/acetoin dehydrogenase alpha subunit